MPWLTRSAVALLVIELSQVVVGVTQARLGLPPLLVGIHMVLACVLAAAMAWVVLSLREAVPAEEPVSPVAAGA
jgi:cytochrome c oxidase assembly protein subunit 15